MSDESGNDLLPIALVGLAAFGLVAFLFHKLKDAKVSFPAPAPAPPVSPRQPAPPRKGTKLPTVTPGQSSGILLAAIKAGKAQPIDWVTIDLDGMKVEVASDAMKAAIPDGSVIRLPMSYSEDIEAARVMSANGLDVIVPSAKIADAMYAQASAHGQLNGLVRTAADSGQRMMSLDFSKRFNADIDKQFEGKSGLLMGPWKLWILNSRIGVPTAEGPAAINYGGWSPSSTMKNTCGGVKCWQPAGAAHGYFEKDYSQAFQPVKRWALNADGTRVDLLDWIEKNESVTPAQTAPFRNNALVA